MAQQVVWQVVGLYDWCPTHMYVKLQIPRARENNVKGHDFTRCMCT